MAENKSDSINNEFVDDLEEELLVPAIPRELELQEPILRENKHTYIFSQRNINKTLYKWYEKHQQSLWVVAEIRELATDLKTWNNMLTKEQQDYLKIVLAFFAAADGLVMENIAMNFIEEVTAMEARQFYALQMYMESVHSQTYALLLDTYIKNEMEKEYLFQGLETIPSVKRKGLWTRKYMNPKLSFAERLLAFIAVEFVFFSGSFTSIFYLGSIVTGMPGLTYSNELISRDEGFHVNFAVDLYRLLHYPLSEKCAHKILQSAVQVESQYVAECLKVDLIGLSKRKLNHYIEFTTDNLLKSLNYNIIWGSKMELDFMEKISLEGKTNFFERPVGEYKSSTTSTRGESLDVFNPNLDV